MGKKDVRKKECNKGTKSKDTLILYFSDHYEFAKYDGNEVSLTLNQPEMLRYFLLHTTKQSPATKNHFLRILDTRSEDGELINNTYVQAVRRLRGKINQLNILNYLMISQTFFIKIS